MTLNWTFRLDIGTLMLLVNCADRRTLAKALCGLPPDQIENIYQCMAIGKFTKLLEIRELMDYSYYLTKNEIQVSRMKIRQLYSLLKRKNLSWEIDEKQMANCW